MDIRRLRYFITIVEEGQITLAAKKLNMAQPPLSQQLKKLEEQLGTKLIVRHGRQLELTEAGKVLYEKGLQLIYRLEEMVMEVKETGGGMHGTLAIGTAKSCLNYLPQRVRLFKDQFPNVTLKIWEGDPSRMSEDLLNRKIELAIVRHPIDLQYFDMISLGEESFVVITPKEWDLGGKTRLSWSEIAELPLFLLHRTSGEGAYEMVLNEFNKRGLKGNIVGESPDAMILLSMVEAGVAVTLLPRSTVSAYSREHINVLELEEPTLTTEPLVIWLKGSYLSTPAQRFIGLFQ